jgi:hypothetical protein
MYSSTPLIPDLRDNDSVAIWYGPNHNVICERCGAEVLESGIPTHQTTKHCKAWSRERQLHRDGWIKCTINQIVLASAGAPAQEAYTNYVNEDSTVKAELWTPAWVSAAWYLLNGHMTKIPIAGKATEFNAEVARVRENTDLEIVLVTEAILHASGDYKVALMYALEMMNDARVARAG